MVLSERTNATNCAEILDLTNLTFPTTKLPPEASSRRRSRTIFGLKNASGCVKFYQFYKRSATETFNLPWVFINFFGVEWRLKQYILTLKTIITDFFIYLYCNVTGCFSNSKLITINDRRSLFTGQNIIGGKEKLNRHCK